MPARKAFTASALGVLAALSAAIALTPAMAAAPAAHQAPAAHHMIVAAEPDAAAAGLEMLRAGGSAVDAIIAAQMVLGLEEPQSSGLGGGSYLVVADGAAIAAYDGRETAPASATPGMFLDAQGQPNRHDDMVPGGLSVGVPGTIAVLALAHKEHGRLPWARLFEPAIKLAQNGYKVPPRLAAELAEGGPKLAAMRDIRAAFFTADGTPVKAGQVWRNVKLADTMRRIAAGGPDVFYKGTIAADIANAVSNAPLHPTVMTQADLAAYKPKERPALCGLYRAYRVCSLPPSTSGGTTVLEILGLLTRFPSSSLQPGTLSAVHLISEASRLAYADRARWLGDTDFVEVPLRGLLDPAYLDMRSHVIDPMHDIGPAEAGMPFMQKGEILDYAPQRPQIEQGTSHLVAVDDKGEVVSMTTSVESAFGAQIMADGFILNNQLTDFSFEPVIDGKPVANAPAAGKRPLSAMTPVIVFGPDGKVFAALGSPGGRQIIAFVAQALVGLIDGAQSMKDAAAEPRFANLNGPTFLEKGTALDALAPALTAMGHSIRSVASFQALMDFAAFPVAMRAPPTRAGKALRSAIRLARVAAMTDALFQDASRAHQAGDLRTAQALYHQILRANPRHFEALFSLSQLHFQCGQFEEAERFAGEATRCNPRSPEAWYLRGSVLQRLGRHADALSAFARALSERPGFAQALVNRGASLMALKRPGEALKSFDAALAADANLAQAWNNRGNALSALGRSAEAIESYNRVLAMMPGMPQALINRGTAFQSLKRYREALTSYDEAALSQPANADAFSGRGNALFELQDYEAAADAYKAALAADPDYKYAWGNFAFSRLHGCAWDGIETIRRETAAQLRAGKGAVSPFQAVALFGEDRDHLQCAQIWAADKYPPNPPLWTGQRYVHEKIRVAYVSGDFRNHAVAKVMVGVLENHNRAHVETIGVSFGPDDESPLRTRVMGAFDKVIDARELSDPETAGLMRQFDIDIAVDLMGYTGDCRPGIFSHRPAPVQVNFLGFPGTMGAEYFDYIIADATVIPDGQRIFYSEKIVHLPKTFMPWDSQQTIASLPSRAAAGLPETGFVFASFNNTYKFSPEIFDVWMRLMARVEDSVLWLHEGNPWAMRNLKAEAEKRGIAQERLIFAPFAPKAEDHLARLGLADLFLDTLPYNAHATALDALTSGVPVLTTPGASFASRVAASIVKAAGLPELVASSLADYESLALTLATDPGLCGTFKTRLARNRTTAPLFDTCRFTCRLETAYAMMRERQRRGEAPADFTVAEA